MHSRVVRIEVSTTLRWLQQHRHCTGSAGLTKVFDRNLFKKHRCGTVTAVGADYYDYLRIEMANRLVDRLDDITRKFPLALDLGCHRGHLYRAINENEGIGGIEHLVQCDISANSVEQARVVSENGIIKSSFVVADEEALPFDDKQFDLVLSSLTMHWVNEIPAVLEKIKGILKPDGAFIGCMIGGNSLAELRHSLYLAELERTGGMSPVIQLYSAIALPI
jgi:NADH dehydrogenase [ubiquinone] 1 alpha subcomplex assembly factor 5